MKRQVGNSIRMEWTILRNGQAEDFSLAQDIKIVAFIPNLSSDKIDVPISRINNVFHIDIEGDLLSIGKYTLHLTYKVPNPAYESGFEMVSTAVKDAFQILPLGSAEDLDCDITSNVIYCLDGATFIPTLTESATEVIISWTNNRGLPNPDPVNIRGTSGKSAFEIWKEFIGQPTATEQDFFDYLQEPAIVAADLAIAAANLANSAASAASAAALAANDTADDANAAATSATSAASAANSAASSANTAASNVNSAATAANTAATNAQNVANTYATTLANKIDKTAVKQVTGTSTTDLMSQNAITNLYSGITNTLMYPEVEALKARGVSLSALFPISARKIDLEVDNMRYPYPNWYYSPFAHLTSKALGLIPTSGAGDLNVTRGTTATYTDRFGVIQVAPINMPRIDWQDGRAGLYIEPQSTNLFLNSDAPVTQNITTTAQSYTLSFYGSGSIALSGSYTGTLTGTASYKRAILTFTATAGTLTLTVSGEVNKVQLGATVNATSYIPTTGAIATRNSDVVNVTGASAIIPQGAGVMYVEAYFLNNQECEIIDVTPSTDTAANCIALYISGTGSVRMSVRGSSVGPLVSSANNVIATNGGRYKMAVLYQSGGTAKLYVNGTKIGEAVSGAFSQTFERIVLGRNTQYFVTTNRMGRRILNAMLIPAYLTESDLVTLTTL